MEEIADAPQGQSGPIECPNAKDPLVRLFIFAGMCIAFTIWCFVDMKKTPNYVSPSEDINEFGSWAANHLPPFVLIPLALILLVLALRMMRSVLVADDEGIGYAGKGKIAWGDVTKLDASQLKSKGLLLVHYGKDKKLKLDSWKLKNFRDMVAFVESRVPADKIVS